MGEEASCARLWLQAVVSGLHRAWRGVTKSATPLVSSGMVWEGTRNGSAR